jgi:hypothetical protein
VIIPGNDVVISVNLDSVESIRSAYEALSMDAMIVQSLDKMFWGAWIAQLIDKFGKRKWMLHHHEVVAKAPSVEPEEDAAAVDAKSRDEKVAYGLASL